MFVGRTICMQAEFKQDTEGWYSAVQAAICVSLSHTFANSGHTVGGVSEIRSAYGDESRASSSPELGV